MFKKLKKTKVHFIGIGGIGMSGLAQILLNMGHEVSGSDLSENYTVKELKERGAKFFLGHQASNLPLDTDVVVYSSAVKPTNPEWVQANAHGIPVIRRAEMLAELMRLKYGMAIAGTHGKTTTTSFLATILNEAKLDPTHVIGGIVKNLGGHAKVGKGEFMVVEADESDGSFLLLNPVMSVITNIDNDHLDYYQNEENILKAFVEFANKIPFYGRCSVNLHDDNIKKLLKEMKRPYRTYGICDKKFNQAIDVKNLDFAADDIKYFPTYTTYTLYYQGKREGEITINVPGQHNVMNSLGAISMAYEIEIPFQQIAAGIQNFRGVGRRLESIFKSENVEAIDDYAHHPTEIITTLKALKETRNEKVVAFFEPHRYTRTQSCWQNFLHCFNYADELYLFPIYAASEAEIEGISSERLVEDINRLHPKFAQYVPSLDDLGAILKQRKDKNTIYVFLGAGAIGKKAREAVKVLE